MNDDGVLAPPEPFDRKFFADREDLVAARWWHQAMASRPAHADGLPFDAETRRNMLFVLGGTFAIGIFAAVVVSSRSRDEDDYDDYDVAELDALGAQRLRGWAVGTAGARLAYDGASDVDAAGRADWRAGLYTLVGELAPTQAGLAPYYVPTLFQVLSSSDFAAGVVPIHRPAMDSTLLQARALADVFGPGRDDVALLIDVPGAMAVAAAAGVADRFEPVFTFDNWPHPLGVVPSHEVIAAAIYYRPTFAGSRHRRGPAAPPAFVVDSRRLAPYKDESDRFDNRYLARLPGAEAFTRLGIRHLLYVTDFPVAHEADDLNDDFVALERGGIDVKAVALSDFEPVALGGGGVPSYGYAGSASPRYWFWSRYSWHAPPPPPVGARAAPPTLKLSGGQTYRPMPRPTIFSSRVVGGVAGVGKQKPSGFGRVSLRASRATGVLSIGRSGSLGRSRYSHGG